MTDALNEYVSVYYLMLEHALTLNAKEVMQWFQIAQYPTLTPEAKKEIFKIYNRIISGGEQVSGDTIEKERKKLRKIMGN